MSSRKEMGNNDKCSVGMVVMNGSSEGGRKSRRRKRAKERKSEHEGEERLAVK